MFQWDANPRGNLNPVNRTAVNPGGLVQMGCADPCRKHFIIIHNVHSIDCIIHSFAALREFPDEYGATEEDGKRCLEYRWLQSENFTEGWKYNEKLQR